MEIHTVELPKLYQAKAQSKKRTLLKQRASGMREAPTHSEERLWQQLRSSKLGVGFRRQAVLGGRYIVDFVAPKVKVVVEVDGPYHQRRVQADARRERALERLGYRVVRVTDELVERELPQALALSARRLEAGEHRPGAPLR